jgi:hypothetical protein
MEKVIQKIIPVALCVTFALRRCTAAVMSWRTYCIDSHFPSKEYWTPYYRRPLRMICFRRNLTIAYSPPVNRLSTFGRQMILFCLAWEFDFTHVNDQYAKLKRITSCIPCTYHSRTWLYLDLEVRQLLKSTGGVNLMDIMNSRIMTGAGNTVLNQL